MTNFEVLKKGLTLIAKNHHFGANVEDWEDDGEICIFGGCNIPTISDVQMLCEDVKLPKENIETSENGIDVFLTYNWMRRFGNAEYVETGLELWKRPEQRL